jgi:hypothetical protein
VLLVLLAPALARADGQPVLGYADPSTALRSADGAHRYRVHPGPHWTLVENVSAAGTLTHTIPGAFVIPLVAFDGTAGGLSADGRTLVLARPRSAYPQRVSELAVLDTETLRLMRIVRLRGDFSLDAVSPHGIWIYLIQYSSGSAIDYRVRALNARTGRLLGREIVDPHERGEAMRGIPLSRVSSPDGRWAYTLYDGEPTPFIHALDTTQLRARCIDLRAFPRNLNPYAVRLRLHAHRLLARIEPRTLDEIDTTLLRPIPPRPETRTVRTAASATGPLSALAVILLAVGAAIILRRRAHPV